MDRNEVNEVTPTLWPDFQNAKEEQIRILHLVWLIRSDLHFKFKDPAIEFDTGLAFWSLFFGRAQFRRLRASDFGAWFREAMDAERAAWPEHALPFTEAMGQLLELREDLRAAFDLRRRDGRDKFLRWFLTHGLKDYELGTLMAPAHRRRLSEAVTEKNDGNAADVTQRITRLMELEWRARPDLQAAFDVGQENGRFAFRAWFFKSGIWENGWWPLLNDEDQEALRERVGDGPLTRAMVAQYAARSDLRDRFDLSTANGVERFAVWHLLLDPEAAAGDRLDDRAVAWLLEQLSDSGRTVMPRALTVAPELLADGDAGVLPDDGIRRLQYLTEHEQMAPGCLERLGFDPDWSGKPPAGKSYRKTAPGVTIAGASRGSHGVGEDVRTLALALRSAGVPVSIRDLKSTDTLGDHSISGLRGRSPDRSATLLAMTPSDATSALLGGRSSLFQSQQVIASWPCEIAAWPNWASDLLDPVDEIWASTRFSAAAFRASSAVPVTHLPLPVAIPPFRRRPRSAFGVPDHAFLFLMVFDTHSSLARKNPGAGIAAFQSAFAADDSGAGLVLKVSNAGDDDPEWQRIRDKVASDPRIILISETLDRASLLALTACCDAGLSLHRAEGFGRTIAEAMALGKPAVATGYSGNTDFTKADHACPVGYRLRKIEEGEFPFGSGQFWAEADIEQAAWYMRRLREDAEYRRRIGQSGRRLIEGDFGLQACGAGYRARLEELGVRL
jgi:hypothetical protein